MSGKHECCAHVGRGWNYRACAKTAKHERDGEWYCGTHDPVARKAKQDVRDEERRAWFRLRNAEREQAKRVSDAERTIIDAVMACEESLPPFIADARAALYALTSAARPSSTGGTET